MYKIEIVNKKTKEVITYNNVDDKNNGEKLYYKFEIDATTLTDGEYTINVYNDDNVMVCSDTLNVGEFNTNKLQYERGNNIYISTNLDVTTEDKYVTLTSIELTVKPTDGVDAMTSVTINAKPIFDDAYNSGYENGTTDGYDEGVREQKSKLTSIDITKNGTYTTEDGYSNVNVNVIPETYSYKVNTVDEDGLRQLGWDDASIGYFKDNSLHYVTENDAYVVTDENLALKNEITKISDIENFRLNSKLEFLPYIDITEKILERTFYNCDSLISIPQLDTSNVVSMNYMFNNCLSLTTIPPIDTKKVRSMAGMFSGCKLLTSIPQLNTSNATIMNELFKGCSRLSSIPLLDTKNVTNMYGMFYSCFSLTSIPPLDTRNVTNMNSMFYGCSALKYIPQLDSSNMTTMNQMFDGCKLLTSIPQFNTKNITYMDRVFKDCEKITTIPQIDTSKVTNMNQMFQNCYSLKTIPPIDTGKVTNMNNMFDGCSHLESLPLLDFTNVTSFTNFFNGDKKYLTDLGGFKNFKLEWNSNYGLVKAPNLTYQSVMNVINNLYDFRSNGDTSTTRTLKFHPNSMALLSDSDKAIATAKGWVLTS